MARKFFYVCGGLLMLAIAFHVGATTARAQIGGQFTAAFDSAGNITVIMPNGDAYRRDVFNHRFGPSFISMGNFWTGAPTAPIEATWGQVKARYR